MTIAEALSMVDKFKPNAYDAAVKIGWLSKLDGMIHKEVILTHAHELEYETFTPYTSSTATTTELIVPYPYDEDVYNYYLQSMIDRENGETAKYNQSAALYNNAYTAFQSYYNRTVQPLPATSYFKF